jgi:hypothetical protein
MARKVAKGAKEYSMLPQRREVHKEEIDGAQRRKESMGQNGAAHRNDLNYLSGFLK